VDVDILLQNWESEKNYAFLSDFYIYQKPILKKTSIQNCIYEWYMMFGVLNLERSFFLTQVSFYIWYIALRVHFGKEKISYPEHFLCIVYDFT